MGKNKLFFKWQSLFSRQAKDLIRKNLTDNYMAQKNKINQKKKTNYLQNTLCKTKDLETQPLRAGGITSATRM